MELLDVRKSSMIINFYFNYLAFIEKNCHSSIEDGVNNQSKQKI